MNLIDTHAHLDQIENIDQALIEASEAGVQAVVAVGIDLISNQKNLKLKAQSLKPQIFLALGVHPESTESPTTNQAIDFIKDNISQAIAIGEIGLDYWYKWVKKDDTVKQRQRDVFRALLKMAKENNLPAVIHSRGAWRDCLEIAKEEGVIRAVFHWYSGPLDVLDEVLKQGYFISATPSLAYSPQHQEAVKFAPIERTLIETDSPVYFKETDGQDGFRATPKDVVRTLQLYAKLKDLNEQEALEIFNQNAQKFFGISI